jgi:transcriptional regulator with XRE-family HTH domain
MSLKQTRRKRLLSVRELAERAQVAPSTLSAIEAGQRVPHFRTMRRIAAALDVPAEEIAEFARALREDEEEDGQA